MTTKQLSVFIENRKGRLGEVLDVLKENDVNIYSLSLADTTEYGLLRLIVNDAKKARDVLYAEGFSSMLTDVLIIKVPHAPGSLQKILELIAEKDVNIEYMYGLSIESDNAYVVLKASDSAKVDEILTNNGVKTISCKELANI
jgi:hypothetical protein